MRKKHIRCDDCPDGLLETHAVGKTTREWLMTTQVSPALSESGIFLCGWSIADKDFTFIRPRFPMSQILVCTSGVGEVWINGEWRECLPGMAYVNPAHIFHAYRARPDLSPRGEPWTVYWITYYMPSIEGKEPILVSCDPGPFSDAMRHLYSEANGIRDPQSLRRWSQVLDLCARRIAQVPPGDSRLHRLWDAVMASPEYPWGTVSLAKKAKISTEHLRRLCQSEIGCGPMEHVTHLRMQYAVSLFVSGRYSVAAVAERVGYATPFAFSAAFKRVLGVSPSEYVATKLHPTIEP